MNRTIKFRGLRTDGKGWVYGYIDHNEYNNIAVIHSNADTTQVIPESVGQFTGLHDKNGVEIYEGDILKYKSSHPKHEDKDFENIVEFASGQSLVGWRMRNGKCVVKATPYKFGDSEIIGNIHTQDGGQEG